MKGWGMFRNDGVIKNQWQACLRINASIFLGLVSVMVHADPLSERQATLKKAEAAMQQDAIETTINLLVPLHQANPGDVTVGNNLAVAYIRQQRYQQAQDVLETVLNKDPKFATLRQNLQQIYAYRAQAAYQDVFANTGITLPKGEWILTANYEMDTAKVVALQQVQLDINQVTQNLEMWRSAWSEQNIDGYLAAYDADYYSEDFENRQAWQKNRQLSVQSPRFIQVQLDDITALPLAKDVIQVQFWQAYESNRFKDRVRKKLLWQKRQDEWKIMQETVVYE